jgi:ankyrin repeat protein
MVCETALAKALVTSGYESLLHAAGYGDLPAVRLLVSAGARPGGARSADELADAADDQDRDFTPLLVSAAQGFLEVCKYLVEQGAPVDRARRKGCTPLYIASQQGHLGVVEYLESQGADIDKANDSATPVYIAAQNGFYDVVRFLVDKGADFKQPESRGLTPMWIAVDQGHFDIVLLLARKGARLTRRRNKSAVDGDAVSALIEGIERAGGWSEYVAERRMPHLLIRHRVGEAYATLPVGHSERELYHFMYGRNDLLKAEEEDVPAMRELPDAVFAHVMRFLVS